MEELPWYHSDQESRYLFIETLSEPFLSQDLFRDMSCKLTYACLQNAKLIRPYPFQTIFRNNSIGTHSKTIHASIQVISASLPGWHTRSQGIDMYAHASQYGGKGQACVENPTRDRPHASLRLQRHMAGLWIAGQQNIFGTTQKLNQVKATRRFHNGAQSAPLQRGSGALKRGVHLA